MKIYLANQSKQSLGGGWTFLNTFAKFARAAGVEIVSDWKLSDVFFISGATMVTRDQVQEAKAAGKKIVLRVDNIPRNSRNRNTGTSRLFDFAKLADLVIYQSTWAKEYIGPFLSSVDKSHGPVILNGADDDIFKPGNKRPADGKPQYLYVQFNRDETKQWHQAWYQFVRIHQKNPNAHLWIVGNFSPEQVEYKFDFFQGEKFDYLGVIDRPEDMAEIMRGADHLLLPYFNDACSNTLIEYRRSNPDGQVIYHDSGGNVEIMREHPDRLTASHMTFQYLTEIEKILN